ncbi:hypothetical protein ACFQH8_19390 [Halomicroarcula sp. GCM10025710]
MATERGRRIIDDVPAIGWLVDQGWAARLFGILIGLGAWIWLASVFPNRLMPFPLRHSRSRGTSRFPGPRSHISAGLSG